MELLHYSFKQKNDWTCGPAVARILLDYHGTQMDIEDIVKELRTTRQGTSNTDFLRLLRRKHIPHIVRDNTRLDTLARLARNHWVAVAYWIPFHKVSHYSIVKKIDRRRIYFHDTWYGANHSYTHEHFLKNWWDEEAARWLCAIPK